MKAPRSIFVCQACGHDSPRWVGKCPNCGAWSSFVEERAVARRAPGTPAPARRQRPVSIEDVDVSPGARVMTHLPELDRVLGGGIVPGSVVLVGGDPGIGKSTLMMQAAAALPAQVVLYITGEESVGQIKLRAERLDVAPSRNLLLLAETNLDLIEAVLAHQRPDLLIVDSVQTLFRPALESAPGTVSQVRESATAFMRFAKGEGVPVFLIGHVTKEGAIAGPKVVEHMVDTVLQFEGERHYAYRVLRAMKNRFGPTNEIGIFEMHDGGLREVTNPSEVFLAQRRAGSSGSTVVAGMEGTRPLLVEVQALVAPTSYGVPQRTATGFDGRRLQMLLAVLEKRAGLRLGQYDVFVNVAGGVRLEEPAADLGMAVSIVSSLRDLPVDPEAVVVGEVGLGGEIRRIHQIAQRLAEATKLGFRRVVLPRTGKGAARPANGVDIVEVDTVERALQVLIGA